MTARASRPWLQVAVAMFAIGWGANQFVSLLIAYRLHAGVRVGTGEALVGIYAVGLIPALLLGGPLADKFGRSRVLRPVAVVSVLATVVLMTGAHAVAPLYLGRFLAGVASGGAFAAGTAWVEELSSAPWDSSAAEGTGARRSAIALSAGFGLGPVVAGLIAQWAPNPLVSAYVPHLIVIVLALPGLWRAPETVRPVADSPGLLARMRVPSAGHARFVGVVVPLAPWVFAAPTIGFAVLPGLVSGHTSGLQVAFAAAVSGTVLFFGVLVQPIARRLDAADASRGASVGLLAVVVGVLLAALAAAATNPLLVVLAAVVLGSGYGLCLVAGLLGVQRLAGPDDLAGLTAVYYALTYVGFAAPVLLAALSHYASYPTLLLAAAALAALALGILSARARATRPA